MCRCCDTYPCKHSRPVSAPRVPEETPELPGYDFQPEQSPATIGGAMFKSQPVLPTADAPTATADAELYRVSELLVYHDGDESHDTVSKHLAATLARVRTE